MRQEKPGRRRISLDLSDEMVEWLDRLKQEYGLRERGIVSCSVDKTRRL